MRLRQELCAVSLHAVAVAVAMGDRSICGGGQKHLAPGVLARAFSPAAHARHHLV